MFLGPPPIEDTNGQRSKGPISQGGVLSMISFGAICYYLMFSDCAEIRTIVRELHTRLDLVVF
jgi:hypothetical protein